MLLIGKDGGNCNSLEYRSPWQTIVMNGRGGGALEIDMLIDGWIYIYIYTYIYIYIYRERERERERAKYSCHP